MPRRVTRSTKEAMEVLRQFRSRQIARAGVIAREIARKEGTVHSRLVRAQMKAEGLVSDPKNGALVPKGKREYWLGAIFRHRDFVWTGEWASYHNVVRNIHERSIKVWQLSDEALERGKVGK